MLINGDCLKHFDKFKDCDAIITDPPYGIKNNCNYKRFTGGKNPSRKFNQITNDNKPFDPKPWLEFPKVVLFGFQYFGKDLDLGTVFVWNKRRKNQLGKFLSDCELAWFNQGKGVYLFNHVWNGFDRESERGKTLHPTQKPVALFEWIIDKMKLNPNSLIGDPYMGSGAVGIAAKNKGHRFIGAEIDKGYFNIAQGRIRE